MTLRKRGGIILACLLAAGGPRAEILMTPGGANAPLTYQVKAGPAQMVMGLQDGVLVHTSITNTLGPPPRVSYVEGYEFVIRLKDRDLTAYEFKNTGIEQAGPGALDLDFRAHDLPLAVSLHYRQDEDAPYIRKWLEVKPDPGASFFLDSVVLVCFQPWTEPETFSGPGQPVYVGDTFWGVEYPSAENSVTNGIVVGSYLVGLTVDEAGYRSETAVYGVAAPGAVRAAFLDYIGRIRARPARPFLLWNTWYDLREYRDRDVIDGLAAYERALIGPYGIKLDSVVLDDGWDDYRSFWAPSRKRFPDGFAPVLAECQRAGTAMGLWMSPLGGYPPPQTIRLLDSIGAGREKTLKGYCIAGRHNQHEFAGRMADYAAEGVNYFKLDNLTTSCNNPRHGHRVGKYAQAGLTDAFIEVMREARAARPDLMINITVGSWLSPWWLKHCDVVWRGGMDFGSTGAGSKRQQNITYVDSILYKKLRREQAQFPIDSLMTHGLIKGKKFSHGETGENARDFTDDAWMYFGRGVMMQELYLTPDTLSPAELGALVEAIRFARTHAALLARSEMVLGDPGAGEVYGFWHHGGGESLLVVRNPADAERALPAESGDYLPGLAGGGAAVSRPCETAYSSFSARARDLLGPGEVRFILCPSGP